jgi:hypothetical protein
MSGMKKIYLTSFLSGLISAALFNFIAYSNLSSPIVSKFFENLGLYGSITFLLAVPLPLFIIFMFIFFGRQEFKISAHKIRVVILALLLFELGVVLSLACLFGVIFWVIAHRPPFNLNPCDVSPPCGV